MDEICKDKTVKQLHNHSAVITKICSNTLNKF